MPKYRSKPKIVDAEQFFVDKKPWPDGVKMVNHYIDGKYYIFGDRDIKNSNWALTKEDGDQYIESSDIFEQTYEKVNEGDLMEVGVPEIYDDNGEKVHNGYKVSEESGLESTKQTYEVVE